jgi:hypothetical protein
MDHFKVDQKILESISSCLKEKNINLSVEDLPTVVDQIKDEILYWDVKRLINRVETILEIDPSDLTPLPSKTISISFPLKVR